MIQFLLCDENYTWLAPYGYAIVFLGILIFLFRLFETGYASIFNKPLFRHYLVYKKLKKEQQKILEEQFDFFRSLSKKHKRQFQHRVATFISEKNFIGREDLTITETMRVLIAATGCMLSFGRKNYEYGLIEHILIYPSKFYSKINDAYHKGEFNPKIRALVMSWEDFEKGLRIADDNRNLGIHENLLRRWKREYEDDDKVGSVPGSAAVMQTELNRLRKENKRLKMEREILKKAAAFFAKESG